MKKIFLSTLSLILVFSLVTPSVSAQDFDDPDSVVTELAEHVPGELLIRFSPGINSGQAANKMAEMGVTHKREIPAIRVHLVELPPGLSVEQALEKFSRRPGVEFVEPNYILQVAAPNQVEVTDQWGLKKIEAELAWSTFTEQQKIPVTLAAVDTGIDPTHSDLAANMWSNPDEIPGNGLDDNNNGYIDDTWGWDFVNNDNDPFDDNLHGTAVSSVMAGVQDGAGVAGVCPWCRVMAVKVMSANGTGTMEAVSNGIIYAANSGARVINLSLAGSVGTQTLANAVNFAWAQGALLVGGAGNAGTNALMYPAGYANVMAIGSTGISDTHSCFSNYAEGYISVVAPGENILIALPNQSYGIGSGTSLSTPHVAGLGGLLFSQNPALSNTEVRTLIENTSIDLGPTDVDAVFGHGRVNAYRAVTNDQSQTIPPDGLFSISETASGYAHARKLVQDVYGTLHLIWHTQDGSLYRIRYATSNDNGNSWDLQPDAFSSPYETYHPALAADGDYLYVTIPSRTGTSSKYQILFTRKPLSGGVWSSAESLMGGTVDTVRPDIYVDPSNGRLHMIASSLDNAPYLYYRVSNTQGSTWEDLRQFNPSNSTSNTRYAAIHANGDNIYIATKTVSNNIFYTYYYLYTARSTDGGQTWIDKTQLSWYLALTTGEYGLSLAGVGDRVYMGYEVGSNLYFRRYDGAGWGGVNDYLQLETGSTNAVYKWPTITQSVDGQAWMIFEVNKQLYMRHYDGSTWQPKESMGSGSYSNLKLGTSANRVEWVYTTCNGSPFGLGYESLSIGENSPSTAADDSYSTDEDTTLDVDAPGVLGNDTDADGNSLSAVPNVGPSHGMLTLNSDGSFSYTPNANFNGSDSFVYHANDGTTDSNAALVTITVNAVNDAPLAADDSATTDEDTAVNIDVLANDNDVDGDPLTIDSVTQGSNGTVANNGIDVTYTPAVNFNGIDSFSYTVSDDNGGTDTATVTVTVSPVNDAPVADDDTGTVSEGGTLSVGAPGVLGNDTDPESDSLTVTTLPVTTPTNGNLTLNDDGSYTYTHDGSETTNDSFVYKVCDTDPLCDTATVNLTISPVNDLPVANDDSVSTLEDAPVTITLTGSDPDDDLLTFSVVSDPSNGTLNGAPPSITYTPFNGYSGLDSFTFVVNDGAATSTPGTVSITITAVSVHVGDLDAEVTSKPRNQWDATVTITVHDSAHNPVSAATVNGSWSAGTTGGASCTTNSAGTCYVTKSNLKGNVSSVTFTVDNISHATLTYKVPANHDPDTDSAGTSIIIYQDGPPANQPPVASFTYSCVSLSCDFDASGSSDPDGTISGYTWDFGDGNTSSGVTVNHTYSAQGTYTITLTVVDEEGALDTEFQQIFLGNVQVMHVGDLDGKAEPGRRDRWNATVDILVHNNDHSPVTGVTVLGSWSTGTSGNCITDNSGRCATTLTNIKTNIASVNFSVTELTATGWEYNLQLNHDPDGDSNGTSITISH